MTPWQVLQMVMMGRPMRWARAKFRAFSVSPSSGLLSCSAPAPVHDQPSISSSSMPMRSATAIVDW